MQRGDLVVEIEKEPIATLDDFRRALGKKRDRPFLLRALRGDDTRFVLVNPRSAKADPPASSSPSSSRR
jgi:S1-C subfamily serine protease